MIIWQGNTAASWKPFTNTTGFQLSDGAGRTALSNSLLNQINNDINLVSYNTATNNSFYTLIANAKDEEQTVLTLTPTDISKAP